ncbi:MAG: putative glycoside hydrolase [Candidatus Poribacteria bacterium]|nr:putative glycoside hydrolase [Candidatus Poribacteria bacterium]
MKINRFISTVMLIVLLLCLTTYLHAEECEIDRVSIVERLANRSYPSVYSANEHVIGNKPRPTNEWDWSYHKKMLSYHDLFILASFRSLRFQKFPFEEIKLHAGEVEHVWYEKKEIQSLNPDFLLLAAVNYYGDYPPDSYPEDFPYWLRDEDGNKIQDIPYKEFMIDYTLPGAEDYFVRQAVSIAKCGIFDGIFMDLWSEAEEAEIPSQPNTAHLYHGNRVEALVSLVKRIREAVGDELLIIVNTRTEKIPRSAPYVNGALIETWDAAYPRERLIELEEALSWYEANLRYPQVNCLEVSISPNEPWDSPANRQLARAITTLSLTHSNGYIAVHAKSHRGDVRYWYPFFDAPLGGTLGGDETKGVLYKTPKGEEIEGLFVREFTNGWAVHNRSGTEQTIILPNQATGVDSGLRKRRHTLPDLDGEIYLKTVVQVAPGKHPPLYWVDAKTGTLQRLVDNEVENLVPGIQNATSLAVDAAAGKLYWTEKTGNRIGKIQSANLDGTNTQLIRNLTSAPLDVALNTVGEKLYLSNAWGKIQRMNLDGSNFQPNLITGLKTPQHLVLDSATGQLYWTEQTSKRTGKVQRANLDGSNVQLVKKLTSAPRGMALDAVNKKLYLTNAWGKLQRMNLDGSDFQPNLITGLKAPGQVAVDVIGGKVYWTEKGKLRRADLDGGNIQDVVTGLGELTDIVLGIDAVGQTGVAAAPATQTVVEQTSLLANYPNPFNPETWIPYHLAADTDVEIRIYDTRGGLVRCLELGHQHAGIYTGRGRAAYWDGRNDVGERVASGIYFYQLQADNLSLLRKMVILK